LTIVAGGITISLGSSVNVTECANFGGVLTLNVSDVDLPDEKGEDLIYYSCHTGKFDEVNVIGMPDCKIVTVDPKYEVRIVFVYCC